MIYWPPINRPASRMNDHAAVIREALQTRADGALLVSLHADGTETVFCGDQGGEYVGWQERSYADSKGWTYRADADNAAIAALAALDALVAERGTLVAQAEALHYRILAAEAEVARLREALRYMADYQMTGSERTLHIDFQGIARAALAAPNTKETR